MFRINIMIIILCICYNETQVNAMTPSEFRQILNETKPLPSTRLSRLSLKFIRSGNGS